MLPELASKGGRNKTALTKEFSSADTILDLAGTIALLKRYQLMVDQVKSANNLELLR
jgi:UDP-glucose 4-epimerase